MLYLICCHLCIASIYHALIRVLGLVGSVQQVTVLQLLTEPLQGVQRFVELHWHGHLGQVLADVVPQDVPQADGAGGTGRGQRGAPTSQGHHTANWKRDKQRKRMKLN